MFLRSDEKKDLIVPGSLEEALHFSASHFIKACQSSILEKGSFFVALSGGSTPKALFSLLTTPPYSEQIDWAKVHLFWSDERAVPQNHPDSNFHMAMEAGFSKMPIPSSQIHRMEAESQIEVHALAYENLIKLQLNNKGFDYLMLGMGEDGHTASLFPGTEGLKVHGRIAIANYVPQKNTWRMTLTFEFINLSKNIVIYVMGAGKQEMLKQIFTSKEVLYPIQQIGSKDHKALWIADELAAKLL